jgi:hypothetical protein
MPDLLSQKLFLHFMSFLEIDLNILRTIYQITTSCLQYKCFSEFTKPYSGFPTASFLLFNKRMASLYESVMVA